LPVGALQLVNLRQVHEAVLRALRPLRFAISFAHLHLVVNEGGGQRWNPSWRIRIYGVVVGASVENVKQLLEPLCPNDNATTTPSLIVRASDDLDVAINNSIRPYFTRRPAYVDQASRRVARGRRLRAAELRELALFLGSVRFEHQYLLIQEGQNVEIALRRDRSATAQKS